MSKTKKEWGYQMFSRFREFVLPCIIGVIVPAIEALSWREIKAYHAFKKSIEVKPHKTKEPVIIALIGSASGKISVAEELAEYIGATIVRGDDICIMLQKHEASYEYSCVIAEEVAIEIVRKGGNVILDSDFTDMYKRASIRAKARKADARLVFVRTYCAPETEKPPCAVLANINTAHEVYWRHDIEECAKELLA